MPNGITTDQLNIVIKVDPEKAVQGIDEVKKALDELKEIASERNLTGLKDLSKMFVDLNQSASGLANTDFARIGNGISSMFNALGSIDPSTMAKGAKNAAEAFDKLTGPASAFVERTAGIGAAAKGLEKMVGALEKFDDNVDIEVIRRLKDPLYELGQSVSKMGSGGNNLNQARIGIENITQAVEDFKPHDLEKIGPALDKLQTQLNHFSDQGLKGASALYRFANAMRSLNATGFDANLADNLRNVTKAVSDFVKNTINAIPATTLNRFNQLGLAIGNIVKIKAAERAVDSFGKTTKKASSHSSKFSKILKSIGKGALGAIAAPLKGGINAVQKFGDSFKKLGSTIQRLVLYRFLRSMIRAITQQVKLGIDALYNWSDVVGYRFKAAMDGLATSFQYLRNSVAAMLSPLVEHLQPIIDVLIDKFVAFLNVVNQFISLMTGKTTYVRAIKGAAQYAENTERAAAAQEELNRTILGFDELNKLNDTKDRGHGGAADNAGGGEFEEVPITESFNNINWGDLGKKLSNGLADALNGIDWTTIQQKVKSAVQKVVNFFNGFFGNKDMWVAIGKTLGEGLNTVTLAITTFTDGVDWTNIGSNIADGFKKMVSTINWQNLGKSLVSGLKIFTKLFHGFVSGMKQSDWKELGTNIGKAVDSAIRDIDWAQTITDLIDFASGLLTALVNAVAEIDFADFISQLWKGIKNADWQSIWNNIKKLWAEGSPVLLLIAGFEGAKALAGLAGFHLSALPHILGLTTAVTALQTALGVLLPSAILTLVALSPTVQQFFTDLAVAIGGKPVEEMEALRQGGLETLAQLRDSGVITKTQYSLLATELSKDVSRTKDDVKAVVDKINQMVAENQGNTRSGAKKTSDEVKKHYGSVLDFWKAQRTKLKDESGHTGTDVGTEFSKGLAAQKPTITQAAYSINSAVGQALQSGDPWTWGDDFGYLFSRGLVHSASSYIAPAAYNAAQAARQYLAFSKPDKGPLSDADMYGPDFMKLYAEGIEKSKGLVTAAVTGVASDVNGMLDMQNTYTLNNQPTGLDSLAQAITNSETPINVYIGSDKLDSVIARSNSRLNYRSGGRF